MRYLTHCDKARRVDAPEECVSRCLDPKSYVTGISSLWAIGYSWIIVAANWFDLDPILNHSNK